MYIIFVLIAGEWIFIFAADSCKDAIHIGNFTTDKGLMYRATFILNIINSTIWLILNIGCAVIR